MPTLRDVRRIALALPEACEKTARDGTVSWSVRGKSFAWERPLRPSDLKAIGDAAPTGTILGVWTPDFEMKEALLRSDSAAFVTTPHFDGYAVVLVVLANVTKATLRDVIVESWLARAPKRVANDYLTTPSVAATR